MPVRRYRPIWWRVRRSAEALCSWASSSVVIGFILGMVGSIIADRIKLYFADGDLATIQIAPTSRLVGTLGVVQVLRMDSTVVEQDRFHDWRDSRVLVRVPSGSYEIRLRVLTATFVLARHYFGRGSRTSLPDGHVDVQDPFSDREFVNIAAGQFRMGSAGLKTASPPHEVFLSGFAIRSIPVTACEYASYLAAGQHSEANDEAICTGSDAMKPAVYVAWNDAKRFCEWLSQLKKQSYRLPTEAQYERAIRISGARQEFPWGNSEFDPEKPRTPLANYLDYWRNGAKPDRTPVRSFPSIGGLYDIVGNVWEWTDDWYEPQFYREPVAVQRDCPGPKSSGLHEVVVRGGSFEDPIRKLSCAFRGGVDPAIGYYNVGFRLVR